MELTFDDNLLTGNDMIDTQHRELIERISNFLVACENRESKVIAIKMLDYLDEYTKFHFGEEEKLQQEVHYPEYDKHHAKHEEFKNTINVLYDFLDENEGPNDEFVELVKKNVVDWIFLHIKSFDRSVAEYINIVDNPERL